MPAAAEGAIDDDFAGGRFEPFNDFVEQDGDVAGGVGQGVRSGRNGDLSEGVILAGGWWCRRWGRWEFVMIDVW